MKTPKEKAVELTDKFYQYFPLKMYVKTTDGQISWEYDNFKQAKKCSIETANEILALINETMQGWLDADIVAYWNSVKEEIEKL